MTDFIHAAADAMLIYKIDHPSQRAKELADIIVQAAAEIEQAMPRLRHRGELKKILERCVEINRLENMADRVFRSAMAELFLVLHEGSAGLREIEFCIIVEK